MTREEAIIRLKEGEPFSEIYNPVWDEALDMAIKALEQEPCEDAISRQAVLEQTYNWSKDEFLRVTNPFDYLRKRINDLPSVNPQKPKTGHWVYDDEYSDWIDVTYKCSCCGREIIMPYAERNNLYSNYPYCHCGLKMVDPQEASNRHDKKGGEV